MIKDFALKFSLISILLMSGLTTFSQTDSTTIGSKNRLTGLQNEIMLHPVDAFTAYTLKRGEVIYNQSIVSLPLPGWAMIGITDWFTLNLDFVAILGGLAIEPHRPLPSINTRFSIVKPAKKRPAIAYEAMFFYLWEPFDGQLNPKNTVRLVKDGTNFFNRINVSSLLNSRLQLHISAGFSWTQSVTIENRNREYLIGRKFTNLLSPDASVSLDWRTKPWLSLHLTASYGQTFVYLDNVPRKTQIAYGFRLAPFYRSRYGILRTMRIEGTAFFDYFQDAKEWISIPFPIYPYFYWQWTLGNRD